jgi:hypothetical protein
MVYDNFLNTSDPEYGSVKLHKNYKKVLEFVQNNKRKIKTITIAFFVMTCAILIRFAYDNTDNIKNNVITLDEEVYTIFDLSEFDPKVERSFTVDFPIKTSLVNQRLQKLNIETAETKVREFLKESGYDCIHLRHFGVVYDMIFFNNVTMINPEVVKLSENKVNKKEENLNGEIHFAKRSTSVIVNYIDKDLEKQYGEKLWGNNAICFQFYVI